MELSEKPKVLPVEFLNILAIVYPGKASESSFLNLVLDTLKIQPYEQLYPERTNKIRTVTFCGINGNPVNILITDTHDLKIDIKKDQDRIWLLKLLNGIPYLADYDTDETDPESKPHHVVITLDVTNSVNDKSMDEVLDLYKFIFANFGAYPYILLSSGSESDQPNTSETIPERRRSVSAFLRKQGVNDHKIIAKDGGRETLSGEYLNIPAELGHPDICNVVVLTDYNDWLKMIPTKHPGLLRQRQTMARIKREQLFKEHHLTSRVLEKIIQLKINTTIDENEPSLILPEQWDLIDSGLRNIIDENETHEDTWIALHLLTMSSDLERRISQYSKMRFQVRSLEQLVAISLSDGNLATMSSTYHNNSVLVNEMATRFILQQRVGNNSIKTRNSERVTVLWEMMIRGMEQRIDFAFYDLMETPDVMELLLDLMREEHRGIFDMVRRLANLTDIFWRECLRHRSFCKRIFEDILPVFSASYDVDKLITIVQKYPDILTWDVNYNVDTVARVSDSIRNHVMNMMYTAVVDLSKMDSKTPERVKDALTDWIYNVFHHIGLSKIFKIRSPVTFVSTGSQCLLDDFVEYCQQYPKEVNIHKIYNKRLVFVDE